YGAWDQNGKLTTIDPQYISSVLTDWERRLLSQNAANNQDWGQDPSAIDVEAQNELLTNPNAVKNIIDNKLGGKVDLYDNKQKHLPISIGTPASTPTPTPTPTKTTTGGSGCFVSATKVFAKGGMKNIENLTVEDEVLSYNLTTKQTEYKPVEKTWNFENANHVLEIITQDNSSVEVTFTHPFYTDRGKIEAAKLKVGDILLTVYNKPIRIVDIKIHNYKQPIKTYNLTIKDNHNYFVSENGILGGNISIAEGVAVKQ
ncbi:MAG: Hint domain-containing protein, partial [Candidatus Omnitrophica bacterium]|nr:Hint domain-containing protein [Candidatus Omnitrophota bacterium]